MSNPKRPTLSSMKQGAANQLKKLKARQDARALPVENQPERFSEEGFEWHRSSLLTEEDLEGTSDTVLWYLRSQQEYFNTVKTEVLANLKADPTCQDTGNNVPSGEFETPQPSQNEHGEQNFEASDSIPLNAASPDNHATNPSVYPDEDHDQPQCLEEKIEK